jgi:hypothetical protein
MRKPRCIPGCMAIIFNDLDCPDNNGKMVKVLRAADPEDVAEGFDWVCNPLQTIFTLNEDGLGFGPVFPNDAEFDAIMRDCELWPILPPPIAETTNTVMELETC